MQGRLHAVHRGIAKDLNALFTFLLSVIFDMGRADPPFALLSAWVLFPDCLLVLGGQGEIHIQNSRGFFRKSFERPNRYRG